MRSIHALLWTGLAFGVAACTGPTGQVDKVVAFQEGKALLTSADVRMVTKIKPGVGSRPGQVTPEALVCAEPSPDLARALSNSTNFGLSASVQGLEGLDPKVAASIAQAQAQAVGQLGERLATVQILRDALYRACEAYANGALSEIAYAALLTGFPDTSVSMLQTEIAGGAFGRELFTATTTASGQASSSLESTSEQARKESMKRSLESSEIRKLQQTYDTAAETIERTQSELETERAKSPQDTQKIEELNATLKESTETALEASSKLTSSLKSAAEASASATTASDVGTITGKQNKDIAEAIAAMNKEFLNKKSLSALWLTCIIAMSKNAPETPLVTFCKSALPVLILQSGGGSAPTDIPKAAPPLPTPRRG